MKEEKEQMSAVGMQLTWMIELVIMRMLQPMKDMINELKNDVESIKEWMTHYISVEKFNDLVISMQDMKSDVELSINEAINSLGMPSLPQLDVMFSDIEEKVRELDGKIEDNETKIEDNESNIGEIVSKLGLIGEVLNQ